jgi:hypothetical protein
MSDTSIRPHTAGYPGPGAKPTGWVGWVFFAGIIMAIIGTFQVMMGLVAIFDDGYYLVTDQGLMLSVNYTAWGWLHLILGAVVIAAGVGVMRGQTWARAVGITLAAINAIVNVAFLAAYPVWTVMVVSLDVIVIYALAVHGREAKTNA